MVKGQNWYKNIFSYIGIAVGVLLMAIGLNYFLEPNTIAPGGVTGFAIVLKKTINIPVYITNLIINIPLFILGVKTLGKNSGWKTLYATLLLSFFLKTLPPLFLTHDLLLSSIFGGVLTGIGLGIVFKFGGTTGGTDLAGAILNKYFPKFGLSTFMMMIDLCVVVFAGVVDKKIETSLYSIIALFVTIKVVDLILEGIGYLKGFIIITNKPEEISEKLMKDLDRGVTLFKGKGMYTKEEKDILLCVVNRSQFTETKEIVSEIDKSAFIMVTEMYEVLGEGFDEIKK
ncbi:YitT family protein [Tissierella sp. MSJ-40]|uniref:YitT family protein n=1 Tax=Tissierella simiarum TaxID=2841534 RepID=A0ABS6E6V7_9FIRM|nr:YitT family protein [Tissierella simiarum]MBU5438499.1 YitT family protein [Tissierella simiarum]